MKKLIYAFRKVSDFLRVLAVAGTGGIYIVAKDIGAEPIVGAYIAAMFGIICIVVAFVIDAVTGENDE